MVTLLYCLVVTFSIPADTIRSPKGAPKFPKPQSTMPNAKPSFRSDMPVHKPDEGVNVPMPNSAANFRTFQIPPVKPVPGDSTKRRNTD
ncbi:hypothetical protein ACFPMF_06085 [Larkinella bovis]|uniref:Uncharacterized protein n=1 Tax=Larkinella bovis TaxID=683041 RepID=A0ABW0I5R7_9BACT